MGACAELRTSNNGIFRSALHGLLVCSPMTRVIAGHFTKNLLGSVSCHAIQMNFSVKESVGVRNWGSHRRNTIHQYGVFGFLAALQIFSEMIHAAALLI